MYENYWGLARKPFDHAIEDRFFFPAESHEGALLKLRYAVENRRGAALLTGAAGLGKSLLISRLLQMLDDTVYRPRVHVVFPTMEPSQLMSFLVGMVTGNCMDQSRLDHSVQELQAFLAQNTREGKHAVMAVDEAHLLDSVSSFETLRMLLNFQSAGPYDLTLLLVGQPLVINSLHRAVGLDDRVSVKCLLRPLSLDETRAYIAHRLAGANATRRIFTDRGIDQVFHQSQGVPSRINRICDLALLIGFAEEISQIDATHVDAVASEIIAIGDKLAA